MNNLLELNDKAKEYIENNNLDINNPKETLDFIVSDIQNNILKSELTDAINSGINLGIRMIFPNQIEQQIVDLNNNIYNYGIKDGLNKSIDDIISLGKSAIGLINNNFENINQVKEAINKGGAIDKISGLLDTGIDNLKNSKIIDSSTANILTTQKDSILKNVEKNINNSFINQSKDMEKLEKNISNWKEFYESKDFSGMEKEYNKIKKNIGKIIPTEEILKEYNKIEEIQSFLKNNGKNFNISDEEIELLNKL